MANGMYRIGVVGASSLAAKELVEMIAESPLAAGDVTLLDVESMEGQLASAGDEAAFVQSVTAESLAGLDFVFFAGDAATTRTHWKDARRAGASIVDMTYALEHEKDVLVRAPWLAGSMPDHATATPSLTTPAVVAAHPAALMLGLIAVRLGAWAQVRSFTATLMVPASDHGRAAMDELHQQTIALLSFQSLPREQFDAQAAFNLLSAVGGEAKVSLREAFERVGLHYRLVGGSGARLALQAVQAPVFHGYVASVLVEVERAVTRREIEAALEGEHIEVVTDDADPLSNLRATAQEKVLVQVQEDEANAADGRFWLCLAADNLKLAALNAISCALEMKRMRPIGKVQ